MTHKKKFFSQRIKAHPDQANILRRFLAFALDLAIIFIISTILYNIISEIRASVGNEEGPKEQIIQDFEERESSVDTQGGSEIKTDTSIKDRYLKILQKNLPAEEFGQAVKMTQAELEESYPEILSRKNRKRSILTFEEGFHILREFLIGYLYFILFFHFKGRTPGKWLLRLKILNLSGENQLGWYQSFERTHGYAASALAGLLGFIQVFWNKEGLAMHDQLARTTVIKLPRKKKLKKEKE